MELAVLCHKVARRRIERGFTTETLKLQQLLSEEIGEMSRELKKLWTKSYGVFDESKLGEEMADVICLLMAIAHEHQIDLEKAILGKFFDKDEGRKWKT